ncbi:hypothetical protein [Streptomyces sp. JW3]|uniref:hypothetical protein n=1 Tax=Streptomyces sp. JW3 TaxID=3456955 RepID=UPI003FA4948C
MTYFSRETPLGAVLPDMFDEDHWRPDFCSPEPDSTRHQVDDVLTVADRYADRPLFLFINVSATHVPHGHCTGDSGDPWQSHGRGIAHPTVLTVPFAAWLSE